MRARKTAADEQDYGSHLDRLDENVNDGFEHDLADIDGVLHVYASIEIRSICG